jgi:hypothetical protein
VLLNALSKDFEFRAFGKNNHELFHQIFEKGELQKGEVKDQAYEAEKIELLLIWTIRYLKSPNLLTLIFISNK